VSTSFLDARFGSKADMCSATRDVRYVPEADITASQETHEPLSPSNPAAPGEARGARDLQCWHGSKRATRSTIDIKASVKR
jgi:hypothetical protein